MRRGMGSLLMVALALAPATSRVLAAPKVPAGPAAPPGAKDKKECLAATNEGQDLRGEGKLRAAREQFLLCAREVCPGALRTECTKWVGELDADIPSIVVRVTRDQLDVEGANVTLDGAPIALDGKPIVLDPGPHTLVASAPPPAAGSSEQKLVLATGEKNRSVTLVLPTTEPKAEPASPPPVIVAPQTSGSGAPAWAWVAGGVGVAGLGVFAFFAATGVHDVHRLDSECAPRCADADVDAAKRKLLFADIGLGVGIVGLGLATYGFLRAPATHEREGVKAAPTVAILPGGAFAGVQGAF